MHRLDPLRLSLPLGVVFLVGCSPGVSFDFSLPSNPEDGEYWLWTLGDEPVDPRAAPGSAATGHGTLAIDFGTDDEPVTLVLSTLFLSSWGGSDGDYHLTFTFCRARVAAGTMCNGGYVRCSWSSTFGRQPQNDGVTLSLSAVEPEVSDTGWTCPLRPASWTVTHSTSIRPPGTKVALTWLFHADDSPPTREALFFQPLR